MVVEWFHQDANLGKEAFLVLRFYLTTYLTIMFLSDKIPHHKPRSEGTLFSPALRGGRGADDRTSYTDHRNALPFKPRCPRAELVPDSACIQAYRSVGRHERLEL